MLLSDYTRTKLFSRLTAAFLYLTYEKTGEKAVILIDKYDKSLVEHYLQVPSNGSDSVINK